MPRYRVPGWWYELRYGSQYHLAIACSVAALLIIAVAASGIFGWLSERMNAMEADCKARGGFVDHGRVPKSGVLQICKGAQY